MKLFFYEASKSALFGLCKHIYYAKITHSSGKILNGSVFGDQIIATIPLVISFLAPITRGHLAWVGLVQWHVARTDRCNSPLHETPSCPPKSYSSSSKGSPAQRHCENFPQIHMFVISKVSERKVTSKEVKSKTFCFRTK